MESKLEEEFSEVFGLIDRLTRSFMTKFEKLEEGLGKIKEKKEEGGGMTAK